MPINYIVREKNAQFAQARFIEKIGTIFDKIPQDLSSIPEGTADAIQAAEKELEAAILGRHLGKQSAGWVFCFEAYPELGLMSWQDWNRYIQDNDLQIVSQYGEPVSLESFETILYHHKCWMGKPAKTTTNNTDPNVPCWPGSWGRLNWLDAEGYEFQVGEFD